MSRPGAIWRGAGLALYGGGIALALGCSMAAAPGSTMASLGAVSGFLVALAGLALALNGRRVAQLFRIEQGHHRHLPAAIRAARRTSRPRGQTIDRA